VTVPALVLGLNTDGFEPFAHNGVYSEAYAFEMPNLFDEDTDQGLALVFLTSSGRKLCDPIVMRAPLNVDPDVTLLVQNRIEAMIIPANFREVKRTMRVISPPPRFTTFPDSRGCREQVVVDIPQGSRVLLPRTRISQGPITLTELLNVFFLRSQLDAKNQWKCPHCGEDSCAYREAKLVRAPPSLIVQLKRFSGGNKVERNSTPVVIGDSVELSHVCDDRNGAAYEVRGVVYHTGTLSSGHYTASCKRLHCWYGFNDKTVFERDGPAGPASESAYLIFLSKVPRDA
jgi:hypothetical protein